jgi:hypothetical protein
MRERPQTKTAGPTHDRAGSFLGLNGSVTRSPIDRTRSRADGDKRIERSKLWRLLAPAVEWLAGEAKPPGVRWLSDYGRNHRWRGTARADECVGRCDRSTHRAAGQSGDRPAWLARMSGERPKGLERGLPGSTKAAPPGTGARKRHQMAKVNAPPPKGGGFSVTDSSPVPSKARHKAAGQRPAQRLPSRARLKTPGPRPAEATRRSPPLGSRRYAHDPGSRYTTPPPRPSRYHCCTRSTPELLPKNWST